MGLLPAALTACWLIPPRSPSDRVALLDRANASHLNILSTWVRRQPAGVVYGLVVHKLRTSSRKEKIQTSRQSLLKAFEARLAMLAEARRLVGQICRLSDGNGSPLPDELSPAIEQLERLKAAVFDRWQTVEVEELAVEHYPLSQARLKGLARHHRPPQSWYDEDSRVLGSGWMS